MLIKVALAAKLWVVGTNLSYDLYRPVSIASVVDVSPWSMQMFTIKGSLCWAFFLPSFFLFFGPPSHFEYPWSLFFYISYQNHSQCDQQHHHTTKHRLRAPLLRFSVSSIHQSINASWCTIITLAHTDMTLHLPSLTLLFTFTFMFHRTSPHYFESYFHWAEQYANLNSTCRSCQSGSHLRYGFRCSTPSCGPEPATSVSYW